MDLILQFIRGHIELISVAALALSSFNFIYGIWRDRQQNKRWDSLNLAKLVIQDLAFTSWRTLNPDEFKKMNWGYADPYVLASSNNTSIIDQQKLLVPVQIVASHPEKGRIEGINAISVGELISELKGRGLDPNDFEITKFYRVNFAVVNVGSTIASDFVLDVQARQSDTVLTGIPTSNPHNLQPDERSYSFVQWAASLSEPFPNDFAIQISLSYRDVHAKPHEIRLKYEYDRKVGAFRRA